ncbi:MAG: erythromycin biosynthesis sensory transduction protein eryC1 [Verrucomicrobia bacterium RIFCSPLOWO2_12_FULL_64_8]|nr:MAG: erythromycin biosynthesis sensory transduction protein eryC1 [Verrucomicrobia bacterium RIFCSPLOWO2_12_FULL_64_8]
MKVPYFDLPARIRSVRPELEAAIGRTLDSGAFCLGPEVAAFEKDFAAFTGSSHCLGFNSGTSALHVAMRLLDLGPGDEVVTTPFTFIATSWAIVYTGARPVYVDIDEDTMTLDPRLVERAVTPRTKAVVPVHLYGQPGDLDSLLEICRRRKLALVEDAAQAHGARYRGKPVGTFGDIAIYSFYPGKNLGACGEGGALATDRADYAARARSLREHGAARRYYHDEIGYNYRMEGIQGATLAVMLKRLPAWNARRRAIAHRYHELLKDTPLRLPREAAYAESVYHLYVVRHPTRDRLHEYLASREIGTALHYPVPLHLQKCFAHFGCKAGDFPVAERAARECLSLPIYPEMSDAQVEQVAAAIREFTGW